jgi:DNA-binding PadR family transcriptional regulator
MTFHGEKMTNKGQSNVLMQSLTERGARNVAAMLKRKGYTQATIEDCRRRSPLEIAAYFEPYDEDAKQELIRQIAKAAGLQP